MQEFLVVAKELLIASYEGVCDTGEQTFLDAVSEVLGHLLFSRNEGAVFKLVHALFASQHRKEIERLQSQSRKHASIRLRELRVLELKLETVS